MMRRLPWGLIWLSITAIGIGLFAYTLGLEKSDKLASVGSFVLALAALIAAVRTYLRSDSGAVAPSHSKYYLEANHNRGNIVHGESPKVTIKRAR